MNEIQKPHKPKLISLVWLIPVIILIFVGWTEYNNFINKKNKITLITDTANGFKIDVTPLEYRGVKIGKITDLSLTKDLNHTLITVMIEKKYMPLATKQGNIFWIDKPRVTINKVSGLNTILSGYKIQLSPNFDTNKTTYKFKLYENPPLKGYFIKLHTTSHINLYTPILYKGVKIGQIIDKKFNDNFILTAIIYNQYKKFINNSSIFIKNPILKVDSKGINLKINSLSSALLGSINVSTPKKEKLTKKEFTLYNSTDEIIPKKPILLVIKNEYNLQKNTPIIYNSQKIGFIKSIYLNKNKLIAKSYIYNKYGYLLSDNSIFLLQKPEVSINGVKNIKSVVFGNFISILPHSGKLTKKIFNVYENPINKENSILLSLYTNSLHSITKNSKVYYKNIPIGRVIDYTLTKNLRQIKIDIAINKKYKSLINNYSMFYDISSELITLKNMNIKVNFAGLNPLINGGIALVTTPHKQLTKHNFKLYSSYQTVEKIKKLKYSGFTKTAYFSNNIKLDKNMNIEYKNQIIGFIKNISYKDENTSIAKLFIYNKYKKLISNHSRFYKKPAVKFQANFNGIDFKIDNLTSLLKGSIVLYNTNKTFDTLNIYPTLKTIQIADNSIKITFHNAQGVKIGSKIEYKDIAVGEVIDIKPSENKTTITALLYNKDFSKKGSVFYLKQPIVSINEIKNASALILPVNIGVEKGKGKYCSNFIGYDKKPLFLDAKYGKIFTIYTDISTLSINAPVYYKNIPIGKIVKISLTKDAQKVKIYAFIKKPYLKLIRKNSKFYNISGVEMKFSIFGSAKIKTNTLTSMLKGGVLVVTPEKYSQKANENDKFTLIKNLPEDWQDISPKIP